MADAASVLDLFSNPNFQSLLAGIGAKLDPQGVGGALGTATQQYVQSLAAQKALAQQETARQQQRQDVQDLIRAHMRSLGGITPPGEGGLNSVKIGPDKIMYDFQLPPLPNLGPTTPTPTPASPTPATAGAPSTLRPSDIIPF